jgi:tetratricopeptide (TPR) repeat protein
MMDTLPVAGYAAPYDYSQPLDTDTATTEAAVSSQPTQAAMSVFDQARDAFRAENYAQALQLVDQAIRQVPNDPTEHQFRALTLFALKRYSESATALYSVLSVGPGWDWTTLISLYNNPDTFTAQLRALETIAHGSSAGPAEHFILAYLYMTEGFAEQAAREFQKVVSLAPSDTLSARLLAQLESDRKSAAEAAQAGPDAKPGASAPNEVAAPASGTPEAKIFSIVGTWTASPAPNQEITLSVTPDHMFTWSVSQAGKVHELRGQSNYGNGLLTLAPGQGEPLAGRVVWQDDSHFTFQAGGGGPADPGLSFHKK